MTQILPLLCLQEHFILDLQDLQGSPDLKEQQVIIFVNLSNVSEVALDFFACYSDQWGKRAHHNLFLPANF